MTPAEAAALLAVAAAFDNRKPDADAATAWSVALDGYRPADCRDAIIDHYRTSTDWIMPAHIIRRVRMVQAERIREVWKLSPPDDLSTIVDPAEHTRRYQAWMRDALDALANGEQLPVEPRTISGTPPEDARRMLDRLRADEAVADAAERAHSTTDEREEPRT